jgi:exodeoxyribonuclease V alpha subunit
MIEIKGTIEVITYKNEETGFFVCKIKPQDSKDRIVITGKSSINLALGELLEVKGSWKSHPKFGLQLEASQVVVSLPKNLSGIAKYLASGLIKGVGPSIAKSIVERFQEKSLEILEKRPLELTAIKGISEEKAGRIGEAWQANIKVKELMMFLQSCGVTVGMARRLHKNYGEAAINILRDNPYLIAKDIKGIGFLSADKLAQSLGIAKDDSKRIIAGLDYALLEAINQGSCTLPYENLITKASELLGVATTLIEKTFSEQQNTFILVKNQEVLERLDEEAVFTGNPLVFTKPFFFLEEKLAEKLVRIMKSGTSLFKGLDDYQGSLKLAPIQAEALKALATNKILIITGGPGTGKTTLVRAILEQVKRLISKGTNIRIKLAAPTGRAAKRLSEACHFPASTLHRLLEFKSEEGAFKYNENNYLPCDLLIVDEVSMVDLPLMKSVVQALSPHSNLVLVGDLDQLPSIGPGQVLADIIASGVVEVVRLKEIFRQAKDSHIITNAHKIKEGLIPFLGGRSDFIFLEAAEDQEAIDLLKKLVSEEKDSQVLSPMQRGSLGVKALNPLLQTIVNPSQDKYLEYYGTKYYLGDKILQRENNYDKGVFNGDIGSIIRLDKEEGELEVDFDGWKVTYEAGDLDQITLAYAITIHKSQGSEYPTVILPIMTQHFIMLKRNLLYTGVTRAKNKLILIGQKRAIAMAVKSQRGDKRYSKLSAQLVKAASEERVYF